MKRNQHNSISYETFLLSCMQKHDQQHRTFIKELLSIISWLKWMVTMRKIFHLKAFHVNPMEPSNPVRNEWWWLSAISLIQSAHKDKRVSHKIQSLNESTSSPMLPRISLSFLDKDSILGRWWGSACMRTGRETSWGCAFEGDNAEGEIALLSAVSCCSWRDAAGLTSSSSTAGEDFTSNSSASRWEWEEWVIGSIASSLKSSLSSPSSERHQSVRMMTLVTIGSQ